MRNQHFTLKLAKEMKWIGLKATFVKISAKLGQEKLLKMVRWLRWHCPLDTGLKIRALAAWGRARYLSVTEAPHNTHFHTWMGKIHFCSFQTAETGNRTPNSGVKGSGANHHPRAPAQLAKDYMHTTFWEGEMGSSQHKSLLQQGRWWRVLRSPYPTM